MVAAPIRILHLDDNPLDAQLVAMTLETEQEKFPTTLKYVQTEEEYLAALERKDFDIILSDYRMPGYDGDSALASAQEICPETPFIMVTGELGEEFAVERLQRGATDYVLKDRIFRLIPAIKRALNESENKKKRREAERESQRRQGELWAIFQAMDGGVLVLDAEGNVILVNEAEAQMMGYKDANELKHNVAYFADIYEFFDAEGHLVPFEEWPAPRILRGESIANVDLKARNRQTGREWFLSFSGQPVWDESGKQILSVLVARDITERKKSEEDLRNAQRASSEILESIRDPFYSLDSHWRFSYVNAKCEEFFQKRREEMLGRHLLEVFPKVAGTESERVMNTVAATRTPILFQTHSVIRDAWVEVHVSPKVDGGLSILYRDITGRKQMEEAFRQAAERYTTLFNAISEGFAHYKALYDEAGKLIDLLVVDINPAGARISGVEREAQIGRRWKQVWPNVEDDLFAAYEKVDRTGESLHFEHQSAITGGFYHTRVAKIAPGEFVVTFFDITDRRRMEDTLREKEETLALVIEAAGLGLFDYRPMTGQLEWNAVARRHFGLSPQAPIDYEVFLRGLHPDDRKRAHQTVQAVIAPGSSGYYHIEYRTIGLEDGKERWLDARARVFFNEQGEAVRMLGATQDISRNKSLSLALERQNRQLVAERIKWEHLVEGIADEVWSCDAAGKMSLMNLVTHPAMQLEEFTDRTIEQLNEEVDILNIDGTLRAAEDAPLLQALRGRIVRGEEIMSHRTTGIKRYRQYSAVPVRDTEGNIIGSVAIVRDITQARQAEMDARRAEHAVRLINEDLEERVRQRTVALEAANKELESFSYSISHDLKAPLRLIGGFVDLLVRQGQENLTGKQKESLAIIQSQAARMDDLIKALLEFSRLTRKGLRLAGVDTRRMVEEAVAEQRQILGGEAGNRVLVEVAELPRVEADPILLRIVFTNLLSNAFKFTRTVAHPKVAVDAKEVDGFWSFRVQDNGVGFPKGQTERLFRVFQRLHGIGEFEGTGIGLANVRKIVERHGGQVCGDGEEGKGASFFFTLPVKSRPSEISEDRTSRLAV